MPNIKYEYFVGAIYDVDDTLLCNRPDDGIPHSLHERSRLAAVHEEAEAIGNSALAAVTYEFNRACFLDAPEHTVESAVWTLLARTGIVDPDQPYSADHPNLASIVARKTRLHRDLLRTLGVEVNGASEFVKTLDMAGLAGKQAIASGALLEQIRIFLGKYDLHGIFPRSRIIAHHDAKYPKPNPDPFNRAFLTLGLPDNKEMRHRTLAVEDDPKGLDSAIDAGLYACALQTRFDAEVFTSRPADRRPQIIAADMADLGKQLGLPAHT